MIKSLTDDRPLVRSRNGFRSPALRLFMGLAFLAFLVLNLFLIFRFTTAADQTSTNPRGVGGSGAGTSSDQVSDALAEEGQTRIGASSLSDKVLGVVVEKDREPVSTPTQTGNSGSGGSGPTSPGTTDTSTSTGSTSGGSAGGVSSGDGSGGDSSGGDGSGGDSSGGDSSGGSSSGTGPGGGGPGGSDGSGSGSGDSGGSGGGGGGG